MATAMVMSALLIQSPLQARELDAVIARDGAGSLPPLAGIPIGIKVCRKGGLRGGGAAILDMGDPGYAMRGEAAQQGGPPAFLAAGPPAHAY